MYISVFSSVYLILGFGLLNSCLDLTMKLDWLEDPNKHNLQVATHLCSHRPVSSIFQQSSKFGRQFCMLPGNPQRDLSYCLSGLLSVLPILYAGNMFHLNKIMFLDKPQACRGGTYILNIFYYPKKHTSAFLISD